MKKKDGYILDTSYPVYFYKEMQPLWLKTIFDVLGFHTLSLTQFFSYLELGCAKGINLVIAAICYPQGRFIGIDFNSKHIEEAKKLAKELQLDNIQFIECDFETFLKENIIQFDYIVNHGTFSWVSAIQQQHILEIASKFLSKKGVFYLHYMCFPGSTELQPIQKLLNLVDQQIGKTSLEGIYQGKKLFMDLYEVGAFNHHAKIDPIIKTLEQNDAYLAHEFLTNHWQPFYSVDIHQRVFQSTGMTYIGSANPCDNIDSISIPAKLQTIINNTKESALKEYLKDIARDSKQRVDIFQKRPKSLEPSQHINILSSIEFKSIVTLEKNQKIIFKTGIGYIQAPQEIIFLMMDLLKEKNRKLIDFMQLNDFKNNLYFLIETIFLLMNDGYIQPVLNNEIGVDKNKILAFNQIMQKNNLSIKI